MNYILKRVTFFHMGKEALIRYRSVNQPKTV